MSKYYSEEIEKDSRYRREYLDGISEFLQNSKIKADKQRADYISPEKYKRNPEKYRGEFIKRLGYPLTACREVPTLSEKTFIAKDGNVNIYRMQLKFFGVLNFYGLYFEQVEDKRQKPFVIGLHGGLGTPELVSGINMDSANYNHLVRRITDKGASVFVPQLLLWNTEIYGNDYDKKSIDAKLRQLGGSITSLELYLLRGSIDYFIEKENADETKLGVAGMSYGGMYALHLAAVDTRIKACYSCSWVNDVFVASWGDWCHFNSAETFTCAEIAGLVAPRALAVAMGEKDELFDSKLTVKECEKIKPYFAAFGAESNFKSVIFDGLHEVDKGDAELDFLFDKLNGGN